MLWMRVATALILIPLVVWGIMALSPLGFAIACAVVILLAALEWQNLSGRVTPPLRIFDLLTLMGFMVFLVWLKHFEAIYVGLALSIIPLAAVAAYPRDPFALKKQWGWLFGFLYLTLAWYAIITLRELPNGKPLLLFLLFIVWSADTFAYFAGRFFGKRPFAPSISPKKTWEGFWGGMAGTLVLGGAIIGYFHFSRPFLWTGIVLITALLSVMGDLFESLLKRLNNVKDSGGLLPGHGGVLDRVDSLLLAAPFFTFATALVGGV